MIHVWWHMSDEDRMAMNGKKVWRYYFIDLQPVKPQVGVIRLVNDDWRFFKINKYGKETEKGVTFAFWSSFADTYEEAVNDYNQTVERAATTYDEAAVTMGKDLLPVSETVPEPVVYTFKEAADLLDGCQAYHLRYICQKRAGGRPIRIKPVKVQLEVIRERFAARKYIAINARHFDKFGHLLDKVYFVDNQDYFAMTYEEAVAKYNELVRSGAENYRKGAAEIRKNII